MTNNSTRKVQGSRTFQEENRNSQGRQRNRRALAERSYSQKAPSQRLREADPARLIAFEVLQAVSQSDAYANLLLPAKIRKNKLGRRDAGLATELCYGVLRNQGRYDAIIARCVDREISELDSGVLNALRLGTHQLLAMRVPTHAAVNQMVGLARAVIGAGPASFVNAVLRKISARDADSWLQELTAGVEDPVRIASIQYAHPEWIIRAFRQSLAAHGRPATELETLLEADNQAPVVNLVALPELGSLQEALEAGFSPGKIAPDSVTSSGGDPGRLSSVREGSVRVQDPGSQLVARALAELPLPESTPDERWLDLCAGPGGKAALLAAYASKNGAQLLANEPSAHRAELVRKALTPIPETSWQIRQGDGREIAEEYPEHFHRILIDAPCTGLGALRRRPESRWRRTPSELANLSELQRELLTAGIAALAPGGVLAYVTCSPHPAETIAVVQDALKAHPTLRVLEAGAALDAVALEPVNAGHQSLTQGNGTSGKQRTAEQGTTAQLWPHQHGTDAMFLALIHKPLDAG